MQNGPHSTLLREVPLTNSDIKALVSEEDYDRVVQLLWRMMNTGYIGTGGVENRPGKTPRDDFQLLHRFVLGLGKGRVPEVDHENKVKHDCTRDNIKIKTRAQNMWNSDGYKDGLPKGVTNLPNGKFRSMVRHENKLIHLGCFDTVDEAKKARVDWEKVNWVLAPLHEQQGSD